MNKRKTYIPNQVDNRKIPSDYHSIRHFLILLFLIIAIPIIFISVFAAYCEYPLGLYSEIIITVFAFYILAVIILFLVFLNKGLASRKIQLVSKNENGFKVVEELSTDIKPIINQQEATTAQSEDKTDSKEGKDITPIIDNAPITIGEEIVDLSSLDINKPEIESVQNVSTFNELAFFVNDYYLQKGIKTDVGFQLAASIGTKRFIIMNNNPQNDLFINNLNECFNQDSLIIDAEEKEDITKDIKLYKAINTAIAYNGAPVFMIIKNIGLNEMDNYLNPIKDIIQHQNKVVTIQLGNNLLKVPTNLYILIALDENSSTMNIASDMVLCSTTIHFTSTPCEAHEDLLKPLSFPHFNIPNLLYRLKNSEFLDEEYWKKIDAIEDLFKRSNNFSFDNKMLISLESYVAIMLNNTNSSLDALDECLANFILPICLRVSDPLKLKGDNDLSLLFNSLFNEDSMPISRLVIKSYFSVIAKGE